MKSNALLKAVELSVRKGQAVSLPPMAPGCTVLCLMGVLWITRENDSLDHIVGETSSWTVDGPGLVVVEALQDSIVRILEPEASSPRAVMKEAV